MHKKSKKSWNKLTIEEQNLYLKLLWRDGYTEKAIADFFGTTKGRIVRRRQSKFTTLPRLPERKIRSSVDPERFRDLLQLHKMEEQQK